MNITENTSNINKQPGLLRAIIYELNKLKGLVSTTSTTSVTPKILKGTIQVDNGGNIVSTPTIIYNTLGNTNPFTVVKTSTGIYELRSTGAFNGTLFKVVSVSINNQTRLDPIKLNVNTIMFVNRSLTNSQTAVDIDSGLSEYFTIELY